MVVNLPSWMNSFFNGMYFNIILYNVKCIESAVICFSTYENNHILISLHFNSKKKYIYIYINIKYYRFMQLLKNKKFCTSIF